MNKCIFFDRDGIVNKRKHNGYIESYSEFEFINSFLDIFKKADEFGFLKILITNQQGIGKGLMTEKDLSIIHNKMQFELFQKVGFGFDDIYYSPDLANSGSKTRKPEPGMLLEAIDKWGIDKNKSIFIGDSPTDVQAGINAGVDTVFIGDESVKSSKYNFKSLDDFCSTFDSILSGTEK